MPMTTYLYDRSSENNLPDEIPAKETYRRNLETGVL